MASPPFTAHGTNFFCIPNRSTKTSLRGESRSKRLSPATVIGCTGLGLVTRPSAPIKICLAEETLVAKLVLAGRPPSSELLVRLFLAPVRFPPRLFLQHGCF